MIKNIILRVDPVTLLFMVTLGTTPLVAFFNPFSTPKEASAQTATPQVKEKLPEIPQTRTAAENGTTETTQKTTTSSTTHKIPGLEGTLNINNHLHNHNHNSFANYNNPQMNQYISVANTITNTVTANYHDLQNKAQEFFGSLNWAKFKKLFIMSTIVAGSAWLWWHFFSITRLVLSDDGWGAWKKDTPGEMFVTSDIRQITLELLHDIQRKYMSLEEPGNFMMPLYECFKDIERESKALKELAFAGPWAMRLRLSGFFHVTPEVMLRVKERMARLMFVKKLLVDWLSHHHVELMSRADSALEHKNSELKTKRSLRGSFLCTIAEKLLLNDEYHVNGKDSLKQRSLLPH